MFFLLIILLLFIVPKIFIRFDHAQWPTTDNQLKFIDSFIKFAVILSIRHAWKILLITVLLLLIGTPFIFKVTAETNLLKFFPDDHFVTKDTYLIQEKLSGVMPLQIILDGNKRDDFKKLDNLQQINSLEKWLLAQTEIDKVSSIVGFMKDINKGMNMNEPEFDRLPESDQMISQFLFIYDGEEVYELVNKEFNQTRVLINLNIHNSGEIRDLVSRINDYANHHIKDLKVQVSGEAKVFSDQDRLLISGQMYSLISASILIFAVMLFLFRNLMEALLSMLLNLSPVIVIFIFMG
ncbi:MAG: MMPL family transporter, partial [Gammaproteobacteria bacterium]|nr:MMPL family transporter [Gammaproteobacteria bacterium]